MSGKSSIYEQGQFEVNRPDFISFKKLAIWIEIFKKKSLILDFGLKLLKIGPVFRIESTMRAVVKELKSEKN